MIRIKSLSFRIGGKRILENIDGHFERGSITAVMGENGSGKTSLLRLLAGLKTPFRGNIYIEEKDIARLSLKEKAGRIAYLSQTAVVPELSTAWDTVLAGRKPYFGWNPREEDKEITRRLFADLKIEHLAERRVETLSGGEFQKIRILRLFAQETPVLLLDEPMNNLDLRFQYRLFAYLKELAQKNRTVIAVLHDLNMAIPFSDSFVFLKQGRSVAWGGIGSAVNEAVVREVFGVSCRFVRDGEDLFVFTRA